VLCSNILSLAPLATPLLVASLLALSSPRYIRSTTYSFPSTHKVANQTGIPLALLVTPFAPHPECEKVPVVKKPIVRCGRCGGYVNPWVRWEPDGRGWEVSILHSLKLTHAPNIHN